MKSKPSMTVTVRMARHRQTVSDQLLLGLVTGGMLGPGLVIEGRESNCIRFRKLGVLQRAPDRGEILLSTDESGDTLVECRVWARGLGLRRMLRASIVGAGVISLASLGLGWPLHWAALTGLVIGFLTDGVGWWADRAHFRRQVVAYVHNTTYLKSM